MSVGIDRHRTTDGTEAPIVLLMYPPSLCVSLVLIIPLVFIPPLLNPKGPQVSASSWLPQYFLQVSLLCHVTAASWGAFFETPWIKTWLHWPIFYC